MKSWKIRYIAIPISITAILALCTNSMANQWYVGGSLGYVWQTDSSNSGTTGEFDTGNGSPVVPTGTQINAGTPYGWDTSFDGGWAVAGEGGWMHDSGLRLGLELTYSGNDVDTHKNVNVAGTVIDGVDAAVLTGSSEQLGATVGQVVADGKGDISSTGLFLNAYYDFNRSNDLYPYLGLGIGFMNVNVKYEPSNVGIIDDDETKFAYQLKAGLGYRLTDHFDVYGEYAFRGSDDIEVQNDLFPGDLEVENQQHLLSLGVRYRF